jgi:flavin-binding protein dodecin
MSDQHAYKKVEIVGSSKNSIADAVKRTGRMRQKHKEHGIV